MRKALVFLLLAGTLSGCARQCERMDRNIQSGPRNYEVVMYSGGDTVFYDKFRGVVNNSEGSDGCYYSKGDTLIEISGDYILRSTD